MDAAIELAPMRNLNDFAFEGARFQVPNVSDKERWANRVLNNLLYYQSNYFLMAILVFLLVGMWHPVSMLTGIIAIVVALVAFVQVTENKRELKRLKQQHPVLSVIAISAVVYIVGRLIDAVMVFFFGLCLPALLTLLHASLRMRNVSNKISRFKEYVGLKRTPMGVLLEGLGQEQEAGS